MTNTIQHPDPFVPTLYITPNGVLRAETVNATNLNSPCLSCALWKEIPYQMLGATSGRCSRNRAMHETCPAPRGRIFKRIPDYTIQQTDIPVAVPMLSVYTEE